MPNQSRLVYYTSKFFNCQEIFKTFLKIFLLSENVIRYIIYNEDLGRILSAENSKKYIDKDIYI